MVFAQQGLITSLMQRIEVAERSKEEIIQHQDAQFAKLSACMQTMFAYQQAQQQGVRRLQRRGFSPQ